jgi:hypothetical protein
MIVRRVAAILALAALASASAGFSGATFSSRSTNPGSLFQTSSDWVPPTSSASSPASTSSTTFTVSYSSGDAGGGVKEVELWVKRPGDPGYSKTATDTTPATPSFTYTATAGLGNYSFYTRARDNADNYEAAPASPDATTNLISPDTTRPSSSMSALPTYETSSPFTIAYTASDNSGGSGLADVELWVKRPGDSSYSLAATDTSPTTPSFSYAPSAGEGTYSFYTRAHDNAGNYELAPGSPDDSTLFDVTKPTSTASVPATSSATVTVSYSSADGAGSGVDEVELWVKRPGDSAFSESATDTSPSSASFSYTANAGSGTYQFYTRARDNAGFYEDAPAGADDSTVVDTVRPKAIALSASNGGATVGKWEPNDVIVLTFDEALSTISILSTWTTPGAAQTVTVFGNNSGNSDELSVPSANVGLVSTGGDYVSSDVNFTGSTMSIDAAQKVLTIRLGSLSASDLGDIRTTAVTARNMTFNPHDSITDLAGNAVQNVNPAEADNDVDF